MQRRDFLGVLGGAAAWPVATWAQQPVPVVGLLTAINLPDWATDAIRAGLGETGYVEGRNLTIVSLRRRATSTGCRSWRLIW